MLRYTSSIRRKISNILARRRDHATITSWVLSEYVRQLDNHPGLPLPGRGRAFKSFLRGMKSPVYVRQGTTDRWALADVLLNDEYREAARLVSAGAELILDLGSNVGYSVRVWQGRFPSATIVAVEPAPDNCLVLRANIRASGMGERVRLVQAFAEGASGVGEIDTTEGAWGYRMKEPGSSFSENRIRALTVPEILMEAGVAGRRIDLLKCDIEGSEARVFSSCRDWIQLVAVIAVETHPPYSPDMLIRDLRENGAIPLNPSIATKPNGMALFVAALNSPARGSE